MTRQLTDSEAKHLAGKTVVLGYRKFMADLDTTDFLNEHHEFLSEEAFELGIKTLTEADRDAIAEAVDTAQAVLDVGWPEDGEQDE